jgi:hypothetical protein
MTTSTFTFSRDILRRISGSAPGDAEYLSAYQAACVTEIETAGRAIEAMADGRVPFDASFEPSLRAHVASCRFHARALAEAAKQFERMAEVAGSFLEALERVKPVLDQATKSAASLQRLFGAVSSAPLQGLM